MDPKHRVYYVVNLNQNHNLGGWWRPGWDSYGLLHRRNLFTLKQTISSLKQRPCNVYPDNEYYEMMLSCKKAEETVLVDTLNSLRGVTYRKLED